MCHSPSGAFRVQAPVRACWALADNATATDNPAASPPDTTCCAKRFITDLREKGDSPALLTFHVIASMSVLRIPLQTQRVAGGPRSTVGSIHRRRLVPMLELIRLSEARGMDSEARQGE